MFCVEREIEWGECDAMGIVFYPNYFRWMDAAFHAFTRSEGFDQSVLASQFGIAGTPLIDVGCRFIAPGRFYDPLRIDVAVTELGRSSLSLSYRFGHGAKTLAEGREARVFVSASETGISKCAIPAPIRTRLETHHAR